MNVRRMSAGSYEVKTDIGLFSITGPNQRFDGVNGWEVLFPDGSNHFCYNFKTKKEGIKAIADVVLEELNERL